MTQPPTPPSRTTLCLLRHARAFGQGPDSALVHEGEQHAMRLGQRLAREGFAPVRALCSPYLRARETARLVLAEVAPGMSATHLHELTPEWDPDDALYTLASLDLPAGRVLVVAHLPLLGLLVQKLAEEVVTFSPGTLVEVDVDRECERGRVIRVLGPHTNGG
jgi:phosphohistidine phosphatase